MFRISFQVIDGVDKGRTFLNLGAPVTIGREEGNAIRLNDERVSRFHAKVQEDQGQVVLTDLDSTNGTCVNGEMVQLRLLCPGDRVSIGRSTLLFGTQEEIMASLKEEQVESGNRKLPPGAENTDMLASVDLTPEPEGDVDVFERVPPKLPAKLSPAQAAQLSEVFDFLHRAMADATAQVLIPVGAKEARLPIKHWQRLQASLAFLARYARQITEPDDPTSKLPG